MAMQRVYVGTYQLGWLGTQGELAMQTADSHGLAVLRAGSSAERSRGNQNKENQREPEEYTSRHDSFAKELKASFLGCYLGF